MSAEMAYATGQTVEVRPSLTHYMTIALALGLFVGFLVGYYIERGDPFGWGLAVVAVLALASTVARRVLYSRRARLTVDGEYLTVLPGPHQYPLSEVEAFRIVLHGQRGSWLRPPFEHRYLVIERRDDSPALVDVDWYSLADVALLAEKAGVPLVVDTSLRPGVPGRPIA